MNDVVAAYSRYTDEAHADIADAFPELRQNLIVAETYDEAFGMACVAVINTLVLHQITDPVRFVYHPHREGSDDPMDAFGSLGWKTVAA